MLEKLQNKPTVPKKPLFRIAWYNVLANPYYSRDFSYFSVDIPNRNDFINDEDSDEDNDCEQSDMVSILLNLAYAKSIVAEKFEFNPNYRKDFGEAMT